MKNLSPEKQEQIVRYWTDIISSNLANRSDLDNIKIPEWWKRFYGDYSSKVDKSSPWSGSSDSHIPAGAWAGRAMISRLTNSINSLDKVVAIDSINPEWADDAKNTQDYINHCFYEKLDIERKVIDVAQRSVVEGVSTAKLTPKQYKKTKKRYARDEQNGMKYKIQEFMSKLTGQPVRQLETEEYKEEKLEFDLDVIALSDFIFPQGYSEIKFMPYVGRILRLSKQQMQKRANKEDWINIDKYKDKVNPTTTYTGTIETEEQITKNDYEGKQTNTDKTGNYKLYEIWGYYNLDKTDEPNKQDLSIEDKLCLFIIDIDNKILLYTDYSQIPDLETVFPFAKSPLYDISGRYEGQGLMARVAPLNDQLDAFFNQVNDNSKLCNIILFFVKNQPGVDWNKVDLLTGRVIPLSNITEEFVRQVRLGNPNFDLKDNIRFIMSLIERMAMVTDASMGEIPAGVERPTARGTGMLLREVAINYGPIVKNLQGMVKDLTHMLMEYLYWYMPTKPVDYSIQRQDGTFEKKMFSREMLEHRDSFKVIPLGNVVSVLAEQEKMDAMLLYQTFSQDQSGEVNQFGLKEVLSDAVNPRFKTKILRSPAEQQFLKKMTEMLIAKEQELKTRESHINAYETGVKIGRNGGFVPPEMGGTPATPNVAEQMINQHNQTMQPPQPEGVPSGQ